MTVILFEASVDDCAVEQASVDDPRAAAGDGPESELLVAGNAELSDEENIQRGVKCASDLVRDRYAAARQREDHDIGSAVKVSEVCRELNAGLPPMLVQLFVTKF